MPRKITVEDAMVRYGVTEKTIRRWVKRKELEEFEHDTYSQDDLDQLLSKIVKPAKPEKKIEWERANCKGINTDLFYLEDDLLRHRYIQIRYIRQICFSCPIRRDCYQYGYEKERWGMFGGVTSWERGEIAKKAYDSRFLQALRKDLKIFGVPLEDILEDSNMERDLHS